MRFRSKKEKEFYEILTELLPNTHIEHDYPIGKGLQIDFYIDSPCKMAFEVDGAQHYEFNSMFHTLTDDFIKQVDRDRNKALLCKYKGIALIRVDARKRFDKEEIRASIHAALENMPEPEQTETWEDKAKQRQREYRARQYRLMKERRKR